MFRSIQSAVIVFRAALVTKSRPRRAGKNTENNTICIYIYMIVLEDEYHTPFTLTLL